MAPRASAEFLGDVLARDGATWVRVASGSMAPVVREGDALRVVRLEAGRARPGDVAAFRRGTTVVAHRVLACSPDGLLTKGDAYSETDGLVPWSSVIGRVAAIRTPTGSLVDLEHPAWALVARGLAALARCRPRGRVGWLVLRLPFHLAAWLGR